MAGVKEAGNASRPAAYTAEPDARTAKKTLELEAGNVLLTETVRQAAKEREMIKQEQEAAREQEDYNKREDKEPKDTPELSRQSKWFGIEGKLLEEENIKWSLEMEELWEKLLNWMPTEGGSLSDQLSELSDLYMALLEALLIHTAGEEQAIQKGILDEVLAQKLSLLLEMDLEDLMELLEKTGQTETLNNIKADAYRKTAGENLSSREAGQLFARGRTQALGNSRYFMPETASTRQSDTGVLYRRSGARSVEVSREFSVQKNSGQMQLDQRNRVLSGAKGQDGAEASGKATSYTARELTRANSFAGHINGSGSLLSGKDITARNEEAAGFLAGITAVKGQVYSSTSAQSEAIKAPMQTALNKLIDHYLTQKGMYKSYYYTVNAYERTRNVQKSMEEGLEYAYRQFLEKKNDEAYRRQAAYSEQAGFFQAMLKDMTMEEELKRGLRILEENWGAFLRSIGEKERKDILVTFQKYSRWGQLLHPEIKREKRKEKQPGQKREHIMAAQIICIAAVIITYFLFRLLF